jgi:sugar-specific transcriptional regulator TrmB
MNDEEAIEVLEGLGLSFLQAKIYTALLKTGGKPISVKTLSSLAKVVRQDTYRVLSVLHNRGLVEKILDTPTMYRCVPMNIGMSKLLNQKSEEYKQVKNKTKFMLNNYETSNDIEKHEHDNLHFLLTSSTELFIQKIKKEIAKTTSLIEMIYQQERMSTIAFYLYDDFKKALERGVKIRLITTFGESELDKNLKTLQKLDSIEDTLEIRYVKETPGVGLSLFDNKRCFIRIAPSIGQSLCTTNTNLTKLAKVYFAHIWKENARDYRTISAPMVRASN